MAELDDLKLSHILQFDFSLDSTIRLRSSLFCFVGEQTLVLHLECFAWHGSNLVQAQLDGWLGGAGVLDECAVE